MRTILLAIFLLSVAPIQAQKTLTLKQAKRITLAKNYGIQIAKKDVEVAENMTDRRMNGYLPTVTATAGANGNFGGSSQKFSSGQEASTANAFTWGGNASVAANYTIYNKGRDLTLTQLKESLNLSNLLFRQSIEQNLLQVYNNFYQVAQIAENVNALKDAISISKDRLRRNQYQFDLGQGSGLDVLNAKVDIQRDSVNLLNTLMNLSNAKRNLNVSMGRDANEEFEVELDEEIVHDFTLQSILKGARSENVAVQINRQNLTVREMELKIIDAEKQPTVTAGASYAFNFSDNPTGAFIDQSNAQGLAANVGVNLNIFDGSRKIRRQNSAINISSQRLQLEQVQLELERDIMNAWTNYINALYVLKVEENAVDINRENFERTEELVKIGRLSSIEFRQAQLNLLNAETNVNRAKFDARLREIQLLQLSGKLIEGK